jgi:hypothetical protein
MNKINEKGGDKMKEEKVRVVVEVKEDDYEALLALKQIAGLGWRDLLIAGAVYWINELKIEEQLEKVKSKAEQIKQKQEG